MIEQVGISPLQMFQPSTLTKVISVKNDTGAADLGKSFAGFLDHATQQLQQQKSQTNVLSNEFMIGDLEDVHQLAIANEKMLLGLELTLRVRNKAVEAYQEIMRMQI